MISSVTQILPFLPFLKRFVAQNKRLIGGFFAVNFALLFALILFSPGADFQQLKSGGLSPFKLTLIFLVLSGVLFETVVQLTDVKAAAYFPYSFVVSIAGFAWVYFPKLPRILLYPDSYGYISNDSVRGFVLPAFIDLLIPQNIQSLAWPTSAEEFLALSSHYSLIAYSQWALFLAATGILMYLLHKRFFLGPLFLFVLMVGHQVIFPRAFLTGNVALYLSLVLTEGLGYVWVLGLATFTLWIVTKRRLNVVPAMGLGVFCYIGVEVAPRMIPFSVMGVTIPLVVAFLNPKWATKFFRTIPSLVFSIFILVRSFYNLEHFNVFSFSAFGGHSASGMAIQFADAEDYKKFQNPIEREFAYRVLHHQYRGAEAYKNIFVNRNLWGIGTATYVNLAEEYNLNKSITAYNSFLGPINSVLLFKNPPALVRWWTWFSTQLKDLWNERAYFTPLHFLSLLISFVLVFMTRGKNRVFVASPFLLLLPFASLCLTAGFQGVDYRYLSTGELLLPVVWTILLVESIGTFYFKQSGEQG